MVLNSHSVVGFFDLVLSSIMGESKNGIVVFDLFGLSHFTEIIILSY